MSYTNHTRRYSEYVPDTNVILAIPAVLEPTVQSVTIDDITEEFRNRWADLRAANQILGERLRDLIDKNNKLVDDSKKVKKIIDNKTKRIKDLEEKLTLDSTAIKMYLEKIKKLENKVKSISEKKM